MNHLLKYLYTLNEYNDAGKQTLPKYRKMYCPYSDNQFFLSSVVLIIMTV